MNFFSTKTFQILILLALVSLKCYPSDRNADTVNKRILFFFEELIQQDKKKNQEKSQSTMVISEENLNADTSEKVMLENLSIDEIYNLRIQELDKKTPIKLEYNEQVKSFIDIYTGKRKNEFGKIKGLSELYFPLFEEKLDSRDLPLELKYLSVVESSLNPLAVSPSGAVGLWQFLYNTGNMFDLTIDSYIDERRDPLKSTEAACRYFTYLYNIFNDWQLAIASFNGGPGEIRNAIERSGGKTNFWELQPYLSKQTKNYVPAFIASVYVFNYASDHGIKTVAPIYNYFNIDTVKIKKQLHFDQIADAVKVPVDQLRFLNPQYKTDVIPETKIFSTLILPMEKIVRFLQEEEKIYNSEIIDKNYWTQMAIGADTIGKVKITHTVDRGEFYHKIALNYGCTIENLKMWNHTEDNNLHPGQILTVWVPKDKANTYKKNETQDIEEDYLIYTIQEGDTLWSIAEKFNIKSINDLKTINEDLDEKNIKPGQKIKINW